MSFLINPSDVINYDRSDHDLELFWLFCLVVAGKTARTQARLLENFLTNIGCVENDSPFARIKYASEQGILLEQIKESRLGQYTRLSLAFAQSIRLNLRTCTVEDLESIYGVGPKTARMFLMMTRSEQRMAALDTHVLKFLSSQGVQNVPKSTPSSGNTYRRLEEEFLKLADKSGMPVADYDLMVWRSYAE